MVSDPHDLYAERAVVGALLALGAVPVTVTAIIRPDDLYDPQLRATAEACWDLTAQKRPCDPVTVRAELLRRGQRGTAVEGPWLAGLYSEGIPASAAHHAKLIRDLAVRRQVIAGARRAAQSASNPAVDPYDTAASLHVEAGQLAERTDLARPSNAQDLGDFCAGSLDYDWLIPGLLERGDRLLITGVEGGGKALAADTPILTPKGETTMGAITVGQEVFGPDGLPTLVVAATEIMNGRPCYRVTFSDGSTLVADRDHNWLTETLRAREVRQIAAARLRRSPTLQKRGTDQKHKRRHFPAVVTTEQIRSTLRARDGHALNHSIPTSAPLAYPAQELLIPPYVLGAWLGDGTSIHAMLTSADPEIPARIRAEGQPCRDVSGPGKQYLWALCEPRGPRRAGSLQERLRVNGLIGNKHIPQAYLTASVDQRIALLQGLMDTDGTIDVRGQCEFSVCSERLARDTHTLLLGLGIKVVMRQAPAKLYGRTVGTRYRLQFQTDLPVFHLPRKAERLIPLRTCRATLRYITAVEPIESVPVRCIQVAREDGLFVAGREAIITHNSVLTRQIAVATAAGVHPFTGARNDPRNVLLVDLENGERTLRRHLVSLRQHCDRIHHPVPLRGLMVESLPSGTDLTQPDGEAWLSRLCEDTQPELLVIGPLYRMHATDMAKEEPARHLTRVLDLMRARHRCAVIVETHAPHDSGMGRQRSLRPVGSSLFMRWPEFGYGIRKDQDGSYALVPWRGPRDERSWPRQLRRGGPNEWPWMEAADDPVGRFWQDVEQGSTA